jgi:hypothetical protein
VLASATAVDNAATSSAEATSETAVLIASISSWISARPSATAVSICEPQPFTVLAKELTVPARVERSL